MLNTPVVWLAAAVLLSAGLGAYAVKKNAEIRSARNEGIAIGTGKAATETLEAATEIAAAERAAEAETPVDANIAYYRELCGRSASCRSRGKYRK